MAHHQPFQVTGFHSCDKEVGLRVLNGKENLKPSINSWDWLGNGIYFWEQNPKRALEYAIENASGKQYNKVPIKTPFILGAIVELGNCLNLIEHESLGILHEAYLGLEELYKKIDEPLPVNKGDNRALDCAVIKYIHQSRKESGENPYDSVRGAFSEGEKAYPGTSFTSRHHIQICVLNEDLIKGYYLPLPNKDYNPYLEKDFTP